MLQQNGRRFAHSDSNAFGEDHLDILTQISLIWAAYESIDFDVVLVYIYQFYWCRMIDRWMGRIGDSGAPIWMELDDTENFIRSF